MYKVLKELKKDYLRRGKEITKKQQAKGKANKKPTWDQGESQENALKRNRRMIVKNNSEDI